MYLRSKWKTKKETVEVEEISEKNKIVENMIFKNNVIL